MARNTTHSLLPSNARVRRSAHLARAAAARERKRLRRERAKIHRAREIARELELASLRDQAVEHYSYRATDKKAGDGWPVMRSIAGQAEELFGHSASRDKARKWAREMNENPEQAQG